MRGFPSSVDGQLMRRRRLVKFDSGKAGKKLAWFPTINYGVCAADLGCLNNCPYGVYEWDAATGRPLVAHPDKCHVGCDICFQNCTNHAISLPSKREFRAMIRRLRHEKGLHGTAGSERH